MLVFPDYDVKNGVPLEFAVRRTDHERPDRRIHLPAPAAVDAGLQPRLALRRGEVRSEGTKTLSDQISDRLWKELGLEITPHQFRHAAAYIMLKADPGNYELVRRVLGHRSITTTRNFYIGLETLEATRLFGEMVTDLERDEAPAKLPGRRPMPEKIRACPLCDWPTADREAWERACVAGAAFAAWRCRRPHEAVDADEPGTGLWLPASTSAGEMALFDQNAEAGAHVTPEIIDAFVHELHDRVGSVTRASYVGKNSASRQILAPETRPCLAAGDRGRSPLRGAAAAQISSHRPVRPAAGAWARADQAG